MYHGLTGSASVSEHQGQTKQDFCMDHGPWTMDHGLTGSASVSEHQGQTKQDNTPGPQFHPFNLKSKEGRCCIWNETEGDLRSDVFAYFQCSHFDRIITDNPEIEEIAIWSDGCGYKKL